MPPKKKPVFKKPAIMNITRKDIERAKVNKKGKPRGSNKKGKPKKK